MPGLTSEDLRKLANELDTREKGESQAELAKRVEQLEAQRTELDFSTLTDEQLETLAERLRGPLGVEAREELEERVEENPPSVEEVPPVPTRRTRPGRKAGRAYMWTIDDDGKVQKQSLAHIYSGPDEPDEVEIVEPSDSEEVSAA